MKTKILTIIAAFAFTSIAAQPSAKELEKHQKKVSNSLKKKDGIVSLDTFFYAGLPVCKYESVKRFLGNDIAFDFLSFVDDKKIISGTFVTEGTGENAIYFYSLIFLEANEKLVLSRTENILDLLGSYDVIQNNEINLKNLKNLKLAKEFNTTVPTTSNNQQKTDTVALVKRNINGSISIRTGEIFQDNTKIGSLTSNSEAKDGTIVNYIMIYYTNGQLCAKASSRGATNHTWNLVCSKNNTAHTIESSIIKDEDDIVKFLVDNLYL